MTSIKVTISTRVSSFHAEELHHHHYDHDDPRIHHAHRRPLDPFIESESPSSS